ncbi:aminotransferase class I/II-fold pyridoxal phosphate-dependent enzyme [Natrononativus amylolyticus]|uniref:aminotransferase class I/II-fold pyridoxal phosphate-dependent enzyme n=1 Tax=Natrononativus amylolyticus TaxID=2963434 RepID=UPI0020CDD3CE|nr:aminotransferase class I/II-fold pyridoxal phosphate-dependent enzyme [Natrononativus amylolyticus]
MEDRGFDLEGRLDALEDADRRRTLSPTDRVAARSYFAAPAGGGLPVLDSEEMLVFGSNNYLGLTADQRVQNAARQAAATVGTGSGASRCVSGDTMVHHDVERLLAETTRTDRTLAFSSGYAAAVGALTVLEPDVIFADEYNRTSTVDGAHLTDATIVRYDHCSAPDLHEKLSERAARPGADGESWLVVTDSVFSADGAVAPLSALCDAAEEFGAWTLVDETHAIGLYADAGGIVRAEGLEDRVNVQTGSFANALASQGGYVAGSDALIDCLVSEAGPFVHSAGLAPPAVAAASEALHISRHDDPREGLWENVSHLRDGLESIGFDVLGDSHVLPVLVGDRRETRSVASALRDRSVIARPVCPPRVPEGSSRLRLTPMATHREADVMACLEACQVVGEERGLL